MPDQGDKSFMTRDRPQPSSMTSIAIRDTSLLLSGGGGLCRQIMTAFGELELAELREAFDEFDKVTTCGVSICDLLIVMAILRMGAEQSPQWSCFTC